MGPGNPTPSTHHNPSPSGYIPFSLGIENLTSFVLSNGGHIFIIVVPILAISRHPDIGFHTFNAQRNWAWLLPSGYTATRWR